MILRRLEHHDIGNAGVATGRRRALDIANRSDVDDASELVLDRLAPIPHR